MKKTSLSAYSLLEIVTVMAIFLIILLIILPFSLSQLRESDVLSYTDKITSEISLSQKKAYSYVNNSAYGIAFYADNYVLFDGNSVATATYTQQIDLPASINITNISFNGGTNEVVFPVGSLRPETYGNLRLTDGNITYQINLNQEGLVELNSL